VSGDRQTFYNRHQMVDAPLPIQDRLGMWAMDFSYKPLRVKTIDVPGKGRKQIHYLFYKVVNRTGAPRKFSPRFIIVNEKNERIEDDIVSQAVPAIQVREDPAIPVLGGARIKGILPASIKPDADDVIYGVATWEKWNEKADRFSIYTSHGVE
jgi:hypothetical protein